MKTYSLTVTVSQDKLATLVALLVPESEHLEYHAIPEVEYVSKRSDNQETLQRRHVTVRDATNGEAYPRQLSPKPTQGEKYILSLLSEKHEYTTKQIAQFVDPEKLNPNSTSPIVTSLCKRGMLVRGGSQRNSVYRRATGEKTDALV